MKFKLMSRDEQEREIAKRFKDALQARKPYEKNWQLNEAMLFSPAGATAASSTTYSYDSLSELFSGDLDSGDSNISMNYLFKYFRYIHSQMATNPPAVIPRPTSQDYADRRTAEVADHFVGFLRRTYKAQEEVDLTTLQVLAYGSGFLKTFNDQFAGEPLDLDLKTGDITMTGDLCLKPMLIWDIALDDTARRWRDVRYVFERHLMSVEEAVFKFPEFKDKLESHSGKKARFWDRDDSGNEPKNRIAVWEYTEKGAPWNGMVGKHAFLLDDGSLLGPVRANPHPDAILPYHMLTDIDVPGQVYGKTFLDYIVRLQDILNRLDSVILDNIQAHGVVRMVVYDAAENMQDQISNTGWEIVNVKGTAAQKPDFINPPTLMPDIYKFREQLLAGMEQLAGVNESMFGQVKREMSGFSLQTAINAGNMVRRRLYNKYEAFVESVYKACLLIIQHEWKDARKILVTGQEGALSVAYYSGADLSGGFDLDVQYGSSFSLDPASRREEIMQILPLLKEAGYSMKAILSMLRLNDIGGLFDMASVAARRQLELFDEMIAKYEETGLLVYIKPEELEEHKGMLEAAYEFRMSMAFKVLPKEVKGLLEQHIREREQLATKPPAGVAGPAAEGAGAPPAGVPGLPVLPAAGQLA